MAQSIGIYKGLSQLYFFPTILIKSGLVTSEPVFSIDTNSEVETIGITALNAMKYSPEGISEYDPNTMDSKLFLKAMKAKSWAQIFKNFTYLPVSVKDDFIKLDPSYRNEKYKSYSFDESESMTFKLNEVTEKKLGEIILECLSKCK
jgi:hypothetical protein